MPLWVDGLRTSSSRTKPANLLRLACPIATTADFGCFADVVPGQNIYGGPHNVHQWLNPSAFANPPVATQVGQGDYSPLGGKPAQARGPGFQNLDMSLFKQFPIHESVRLEFRAEAFDLPNWHSFANPGPTSFSYTNLGDLNFHEHFWLQRDHVLAQQSAYSAARFEAVLLNQAPAGMFSLDSPRRISPTALRMVLNSLVPLEAPARLQNRWTGCARREL